ncbi:MAG TPA: ABC transporter substrate-binding protein [Candidatus Ozemobacteraceae bacterium]
MTKVDGFRAIVARKPMLLALCAACALMAVLPLLVVADGSGRASPMFSEHGLTVTDARGKEIRLPNIPRRIVIAGKASFMVLDAVYLFPDAWPRVIGMVREGQGMDAFLAAVDPGYASKTTLGREAGPEQIAAAKPDVVLMKKASTENLGRSLEEIGIPVVCVDFETPAHYDRDLAILGRLLGQEKRANELIRLIHEITSGIGANIAGLDEAGKPRVLLLYYSKRDGTTAYNVPPTSWMQTLLVRMAGGHPLWEGVELGQGWTKVGFEQIAAWDPDQIFIVSYFTEYPIIGKELLADERWKTLRAVRSKNLWLFPGDLLSWDQPDPRWVLGLTWLASKIHPELYPGLDMKNETRAFFKNFYGIEGEAVEKNILPALHGDL